MPCDVCGHTVQQVRGMATKLFWCPRCGSLLETFFDGRRETTQPKITEKFPVVENNQEIGRLKQQVAALAECLDNLHCSYVTLVNSQNWQTDLLIKAEQLLEEANND